jgi:predicted sulfurtransferase
MAASYDHVFLCSFFESSLKGGIRCEKASVMLKRRGVEDVNQLAGGIHRYLEMYGKDGFFKGLNFTFDKRIAMKPPVVQHNDKSDETSVSINDNADDNSQRFKYYCEKSDFLHGDQQKDTAYEMVGRCVSCSAPYVRGSCANISAVV